MASGQETREYMSVLQHIGIIGYSLKGNSVAKEALILKYQQKEWLLIDEHPDEISLVRLALNRITIDASEYHIFMEMLEDIVEMDLIIKEIEATYNSEDIHSQDSMQPTASHTQPSEDILDIYDLTAVMHEVLESNIVCNWKAMGMSLGLNKHLISQIEVDYKDSESCLRNLLEQWLKHATRFGQPSWKKLVAAVADPAGGNDHALARRIAIKHNVPFSSQEDIPDIF